MGFWIYYLFLYDQWCVVEIFVNPSLLVASHFHVNHPGQAPLCPCCSVGWPSVVKTWFLGVESLDKEMFFFWWNHVFVLRQCSIVVLVGPLSKITVCFDVAVSSCNNKAILYLQWYIFTHSDRYVLVFSCKKRQRGFREEFVEGVLECWNLPELKTLQGNIFRYLGQNGYQKWGTLNSFLG